MNSKFVVPGRSQLEASISRAMDWLRQSQLPHGEFPAYASPSREMAEESSFDSSPFVTSFVVYSLSFAGHPLAGEMIAKALDFLQSEMEGPGLWRYWSSRNERHKLLPPDLDDTCCISFVLKQNNRPVRGNKAILVANRNDAGLFHTWLLPTPVSPAGSGDRVEYAVNPEAVLWVSLTGMADDVDCVANANALLYLGENEDTEPVVKYLTGVVFSGGEDECSTFYPDRLSFYYMLARAYCHAAPSLEVVGGTVIERVLALRSCAGSFGNELLTALAVCALLNFGGSAAEIGEAVGYLLAAQRADGSWPRIPMFLGPAPYYGSEDLTTALCVEALAKCRSLAGAGGRQGA